MSSGVAGLLGTGSACSVASRWFSRAKIDPEGEDTVLDGGHRVPEHGEVHEVGLGLLFEAFAVGPLDGGQATRSDRIGPGPEAFHHGVGVELIGHGMMVPA